jgi:hypothetical protein
MFLVSKEFGKSDFLKNLLSSVLIVRSPFDSSLLCFLPLVHSVSS